jgi:hypothetical protein
MLPHRPNPINVARQGKIAWDAEGARPTREAALLVLAHGLFGEPVPIPDQVRDRLPASLKLRRTETQPAEALAQAGRRDMRRRRHRYSRSKVYRFLSSILKLGAKSSDPFHHS